MGDITSILYELGEDVPLPESVKQRIAELEAEIDRLNTALSDIANYDCEGWGSGIRNCHACPSCEARDALTGEGE